jgi:hypothetical protein
MSGFGNIVSKGAQGGAMGGGWGALAGIFSGMAGNAIRDEETGRIK